jgi:hypothetical protein
MLDLQRNRLQNALAALGDAMREVNAAIIEEAGQFRRFDPSRTKDFQVSSKLRLVLPVEGC